MGNSLVIQWLGLCAFTVEGLGSIPGGEKKIPQASQDSKNKTKVGRVYSKSRRKGKAVGVEVREGAGLDVMGMGNGVMSEGSRGASTGPNFLLKGSLWLFCCK